MKWIIILLFLPIAIFLLPSTIVLAISLFPSLIVFLIDNTKRHYMTVTIFFFNLAGSAYFLQLLWKKGHHLSMIGETLSNQMGWLFSFSGTGLGWLIFIILPSIWGQVCKAQSSILTIRLKREQKKLIELWGPDIAKPER